MQISFNTGDASRDEMTALIALLASLGGRLPGTNGAAVVDEIRVKITADTSELTEAVNKALPSESLIAAATAARPTPPAPPPAPPPAADEQDDAGDALDPAALDVEGIPWDARIHSTPPKQNADKTWRKRRGVSEVEYGRIHGELQAGAAPNEATGTASTSTARQAGETAPTRTAPPPPTSSGESEAARPTPPAPPAAESAGTAAQAPEPTAAESATDAARFAGFPQFVQAVNAIRTPAIPYLELNKFAQDLGVASGFKDMKDRPELWEMFFDLAGGQ